MEHLSEGLEKVLQQAIDNGELAGANVLVIQGDRELAYAQCGYRDVATEKPFQRDTICRIYSMSKPVTAVAAMLLVERGLLDLGSSVGEYLPAFQNMQVWENGKKVPARRNVLIKDLLNMTSGISYPGEDASGQEVARVFEEQEARPYGEDAMTTQEWAEKIGQCALAFHPGDAWMYGSSADVLGAVIERISGMSLSEFMEKEIFAPLGMEDTGFYVPEEKRERLATVYEQTKEGCRPYPTHNLGIDYLMERLPAFQSGGAGLCSTIEDYKKLALSLRGYGRQILRPETIAHMTKGGLSPWQQESVWRSWESMAGHDYGNLLRVMKVPAMAMFNGWQGEYGWDGWLGTYFCNSPKNDVTILMFTQRSDAGIMPVTRKLRNVITSWI